MPLGDGWVHLHLHLRLFHGAKNGKPYVYPFAGRSVHREMKVLTIRVPLPFGEGLYSGSGRGRIEASWKRPGVHRKKKDEYGRITRKDYDEFDNLIRVMGDGDNLESVTRMTYDAAGSLEAYDDGIPEDLGDGPLWRV